jgi:hypothetical protein
MRTRAVRGVSRGTVPPCTLNSLSWTFGGYCPNCGHHGLVHPGAGGDLRACALCEVSHLIPEQEPVQLLTRDEHRVIKMLAQAFNLWAESGVKGNDLAEFAMAIHHAQQAVMAQAAARAYPGVYRLAGQRTPGTT